MLVALPVVAVGFVAASAPAGAHSAPTSTAAVSTPRIPMLRMPAPPVDGFPPKLNTTAPRSVRSPVAQVNTARRRRRRGPLESPSTGRNTGMPSQQPVRPYVAALGASNGSFDEVALAITGGESETTALAGSTEESQF